MKKLCLLFTVSIIALSTVFGEIKNGYEREILKTRESLKRYSALLRASHLTPYQRRKIEHSIDSLVSNISNFEITENLLEQFKIISPELYSEIDTLKDSRGRNVKVYVKFIPLARTEIQCWGITRMGPMGNDKEAYCSEYGMFTVSIRIWISNNALVVLAHELGHVKYQVPHFAEYMKYYKENYTFRVDISHTLGHNPDDLSGRSAAQYARRFQKEYNYFLKMRKEKLQSPLILIDRIRKNLTNARVNT